MKFLLLRAAIVLFFAAAYMYAQDDTSIATPPSNNGQVEAPRPTLSLRPTHPPTAPQPAQKSRGSESQRIPLVVPAGTPIRVAVTDRVRIRGEGTPVKAKVTNTVFSFDQPVIPKGSQVLGHIASVKPVGAFQRTLAAADANLTPFHEYTLSFDTLILPDGRQLSLQTNVSPGQLQVIHLVSGPAPPARSSSQKSKIAAAAHDAGQDFKEKLHRASGYVRDPKKIIRPGKMYAKNYLSAQLPVHRQFLQPGTCFDAELQEPLSFGIVKRTSGDLAAIGRQPDQGSVLQAELTSRVSSSDAHPGTAVEAVLTAPLFDSSHQLLLPADSRLIGEVTQAKPAGALHHNGTLRFVFNKIETPEGLRQAMQGSLQGVEVERAANLKIDAEGGATVSDGKGRYLSTGLSILIAAESAHPEHDNGAPDNAADPGAHAVAGASGFKAVGAITSLVAQSKIFSSVLAGYGASMSIYSHFLSRGRDVTFAKHTPMEIAYGKPHVVGGH